MLDAGSALDALDALDAVAVRRWAESSVDLLAAHRSEIDALNVFPVADGDTGSNLLVTLLAGVAELDRAELDRPEAGTAADALARVAAGAARGAVGNSGFIVSQVLRGLAETAAADQPDPVTHAISAARVADGLVAGADMARAAVVDPVEGTVLTVARAAADSARENRDGSLAEVVSAAASAAADALRATTEQLPELARHGVVDAGGRGLVVLLDALVAIVVGAPQPAPSAAREGPPRGHAVVREAGSPEYGFEVQYLLDAADPAPLRTALAPLGDSLAVVPVGGDCWKVHVHVNDVGAAIEAGITAGRVHGIEVVSFAEQAAAATPVAPAPGNGTGTAVVAVAPGKGLAHLFEVEGVFAVDSAVDAVVDSPDADSPDADSPDADSADADAPDADAPDADDVLGAIRSTGAAEIVLLPNAPAVTRAAEAAARQARAEGIRVAVVPTRSPVQGLAAVAVHDASRAFDAAVVAMAEAAAATRVAELTVAAEQALTAVGVCEPGDVLGLIDGEVVEIGRGLLAVAFGIVDRLLGVGAELMTVVTGEGAPARAGELIEAHIRGRAPLTDVAVYAGGQPDHPVIIGAE